MEYKLNSVKVKHISSLTVPHIVGIVEYTVHFELIADEIGFNIDWSLEAPESESLDVVCSTACNQLSKALRDLSNQLSEMATKSSADRYTE